MLKKRLGLEAIEKRNWDVEFIYDFYKIPSTLIIPEGCNKVRKYTFSDCMRLREVVIPESVEKIGEAAFAGCENAAVILKKPKNEFKIGYDAFWMCKGVEYAEKEIRN